MSLFIQNSLTGQKQEFIPLSKGNVNMYTCGVTVYDDSHVGHARSLFIFDSIRKYLIFSGYKVNWVRNITDVDDKIIKRAKAEGMSFDEIRKKYIAHYERDCAALEIDSADKEPKATENISDMVAYIEKLIKAGHAYAVEGEVYFSVRSFKNYGKLSHQAPDEMKNAVRIEENVNKKDPLDFALWKASKEGEPSWPSPWGSGRPGWHIECSVMSQKFLGVETMDIHAGGRDLIFPHHENEIAQSECCTGQLFAKYWIHHGLLTIEGHKMAKSVGNFITIHEILKTYEPNVLKIFFLSAHYRSSIDFSTKILDQKKEALAKIERFLGHAKEKSSQAEAKKSAELDDFVHRFKVAMDDDFNTAVALAVLFDLTAYGNACLADEAKVACGLRAANILLELSGAIGLKLKASVDKELVEGVLVGEARDEAGLNEDEIMKLCQERLEARKNKDFRRADEIRDILIKSGYVIEDKKTQ